MRTDAVIHTTLNRDAREHLGAFEPYCLKLVHVEAEETQDSRARPEIPSILPFTVRINTPKGQSFGLAGG